MIESCTVAKKCFKKSAYRKTTFRIKV